MVNKTKNHSFKTYDIFTVTPDTMLLFFLDTWGKIMIVFWWTM